MVRVKLTTTCTAGIDTTTPTVFTTLLVLKTQCYVDKAAYSFSLKGKIVPAEVLPLMVKLVLPSVLEFDQSNCHLQWRQPECNDGKQVGIAEMPFGQIYS